jgi:HAD superfamily hydrolase (TIGR01509 family)
MRRYDAAFAFGPRDAMAEARERWVLFDWGGTLMAEEGPTDVPMALWPEVRAMDGAVETLALLSPHFRLGVATNASVSPRNLIEIALGRVGLRDHVDDVFCYTEIGARKDEDAFWRTVMERCGVEPESVVMVGDSWDQDIVGPRNFGIHAILYAPAGTVFEREVPVVRTLPEVVPLVRRHFATLAR